MRPEFVLLAPDLPETGLVGLVKRDEINHEAVVNLRPRFAGRPRLGPCCSARAAVRVDLSHLRKRRIAELLLDSVSTECTEEIEAAWVAEAVRRAEQSEHGEIEALDGESVLADLKTKFQSAAR
jgi:hypothetical protein